MPGLVAAIKAGACEGEGVKRLLANHFGHRIGQLDLVAGPALAGSKHVDHLGLQDIAADGGKP